MSKWKRNKSLTRRWQRNHLINKYGFNCYLCSKSFLKMSDITFDHVIPISRGGLDELDNYRLSHLDCNQEKSNMTIEEFNDLQQGC